MKNKICPVIKLIYNELVYRYIIQYYTVVGTAKTPTYILYARQ